MKRYFNIDDTQIINEHMKSCSTTLGKCKIKLQWNISTYLSERLKLKKVTTPNAGKDVEKLDCPCIAGGNIKQLGSGLRN